MNSLGFDKSEKDTKVVVAMSGGVDSSVAAVMLKKQGYDVTGITLKLYSNSNVSKSKSCCAGKDIEDAKNVAQKYNFQHSQALRCVNVDGTLKLASQAASAGVRRFVFLSSIKVNGAYTEPHVPFTPEGIASPTDAYGMSKFEAEQGLKDICQKQDMEFVIIRSPLVYGPGVKGNFRMLMEFVEYGIPLPFSNIRNKRSLIGIDNLVDLVITCVSHPQATDQIFLASDDDDLSTPELLSGIAHALGKPARLFSCPKNVLAAAAKCIGKAALAQKLLESLQVDISETKRLLSWVPPLSVKDGLDRCFPTT